MEHIFFDFEGEQFWIEVGDDGYALRQIIVMADKTLVSCRNDCLAEKTVDTETDCERITEVAFETTWNNSTEKLRRIWDVEKQKYLIGQRIHGVIKYFYPQGAIVDIGNIQGCGDISDNQSIRYSGQRISGTICGFDEKNMWVLFEKCRLD